ncbi:trimeric LpxA-like protein [Piromyces finnis]|uniref:Trimeric LpxA-like protein n=1 Tax=Piromyces finnis TaxID=1754191 RepID=A0A1Y1VA31_9FUNG|nr:trimeric LpxA-like protein [Piromyces finnis]|eukprot:ORX50051.1 trimeric LpxA-like protein [Piromyces finnis]
MDKRTNSNSNSDETESNKKAKLYIEAIEKAEKEEFDEIDNITDNKKDTKDTKNSENDTDKNNKDIEIIEIKEEKEKTEKDKMIMGETYNYNDPQLIKERIECRKLLKKINDSEPEEFDKRLDCFKKLFKKFGDQSYIEPPFRCDYGSNISIDCTYVTIGDNCLIGPDCKIIAVTHPLVEREFEKELTLPVKIGDDCFIGASSIILPGVTIEDKVVIGAGSVVSTNIESNSIVSGNPAKVVGKFDY